MIPMTNKQALEYIKIHRDVHKLHEPNAVLISQALDMACNALEKEDEYKRLLSLAIEQNNPKCKYCIHDEEEPTEERPNPCYSDDPNHHCCEWIHKQTALNLLNNYDYTAKWIETNFGMLYKCSNCGHETSYELSDFCPNCGKWMIE